MRLRGRLERLEAKEQDNRPAVLCLTDKGLRDLHGQLVEPDNLDGVKDHRRDRPEGAMTLKAHLGKLEKPAIKPRDIPEPPAEPPGSWDKLQAYRESSDLTEKLAAHFG